MQNIKRSHLLKALPIVAVSLGRKFGVKMQVGGREAYTDGKVIVLPSIDEKSRHLDAIWGYLAHEAAHIRFTDFSYWNSQQGRSMPKQSLHNILEDGMIEREKAKVFPGTRSSFLDLCEHLIDERLWMDADDFTKQSQSTPPEHTLTGYVLYRVRCDGGLGDQGDLLQGYLDRFRALFLDMFGTQLLQQLDAILDRAHLNNSTRDTDAMAKEIVDLLQGLCYLLLTVPTNEGKAMSPEAMLLLGIGIAGLVVYAYGVIWAEYTTRKAKRRYNKR